MRGLVLLVILLLIIIGAAPFIDGYMFKKIYLNQIAMSTQRLHNNNIKVDVVDYKLGWLKSTSHITVTVTEPTNHTSSYQMPPIVMNVDSVIDHGPFVYDPTAQKYTFAYAVVHSNLHLPDIAKAFVPETNGQGFFQLTSVVPFDGKTWYNHYVMPLVSIGGKAKWDGLTGDAVVHYSPDGNTAIDVDGKVVIGAFNVMPDPNLPTLPQVNVQPISYSITATQKEMNIWNGKSSMSTPGLLVKWADGRIINANNFTSQSTFGTNSTNLYSYNQQMSLNTLQLPATLPITDVSNIKEMLALNNLDAKGMQGYIDFMTSHPEAKKNPDEIANALIKLLAATTNIEWALSMNTSMGASMADVKVSLAALPQTANELATDVNADVNVRVASNLVETVMINYFKKMTPPSATIMPATTMPNPNGPLTTYKKAVAQLLQSHMISLPDSLTLIGLVDQNLSPADFAAKLKAMPSLSPSAATLLQNTYTEYLTQKQQAMTQPAVNPSDPVQMTQTLINQWMQQGFIVKDKTDYVINFSKKANVYMLNGKDVSQQVQGMMHAPAGFPPGGPGPVMPRTNMTPQ